MKTLFLTCLIFFCLVSMTLAEQQRFVIIEEQKLMDYGHYWEKVRVMIDQTTGRQYMIYIARNSDDRVGVGITELKTTGMVWGQDETDKER